jgi:hypothetical protein
MTRYEFRVIPAPKRGLKARGVGSATEARFAHALETAMNEMGRDGWDYIRTDTLPCEERQGLTGRVTAYHNMLVFRRVLPTAVVAAPPAPPAQIAALPADPPLTAPGPDRLAAE